MNQFLHLCFIQFVCYPRHGHFNWSGFLGQKMLQSLRCATKDFTFEVWLVFHPSRSGGFQPNITGSLIGAHHFETSRLLKISACWSRSSLPVFSLSRIVDVSGACCQCFSKTWGCFQTRTERNPKEAGCVLPSICFKLHFFAGANNELRLGDDRPFFHSFPSWKPPNQWFMIWNSWCTAWPANVLFNLGLIDQM